MAMAMKKPHAKIPGVAFLPGFRDTPYGFSLAEERLGIVAWGKGYVTNWSVR